MAGLSGMLRAQNELQLMNGYDIGGMQVLARVFYIKDMILALEDELHEVLNETGWKPWARKRFLNQQKAREEFIDAWHFMLNLALVLEMDEPMISSMYYAKWGENRRRQAAGYEHSERQEPV